MISKSLKRKAEEAKIKFRSGVITYDEARVDIMPFIDVANDYSKKLAKKYNQRYKRISLQSYLRY